MPLFTVERIPWRAHEIWQYISVINTAASSFIWENVYHYDMMFRQLMQFNPNRSWAITYTHMWNLSMRMPLLQKQSNFGGGQNFNSAMISSTNSGRVSSSSNLQHNAQRRGKKLDYCWSFNKGLKCKFGNKCRFIEKCSYCDLPSHGVNICPKLEAKKGEVKAAN